MVTAVQDHSSTLLFYLEEEDVDTKLGSGEPSAAPWRIVPVRDFIRLILDSRAPDRPWILAVDGRGG